MVHAFDWKFTVAIDTFKLDIWSSFSFIEFKSSLITPNCCRIKEYPVLISHSTLSVSDADRFGLDNRIFRGLFLNDERYAGIKQPIHMS